MRKPAIAVAREKVAVAKRVSIAQATPTPSGESTPPVAHMRGRLRARYQFWCTLGISALVLSWVATGFPLQWKQGGGPPPPKFFTNHPSALEHDTFVMGAIADLIATHAAIELPAPAYVSLPLGVVPKHKGSEKFRLIWDGRYLNDHLHIPDLTYEALPHIARMLNPRDFLFALDLKSGYHHLDLDERYHQFFGFSWQGKHYCFTQLPFGLAPACWAFTRLMSEVLGVCRKRQNIRCSGYLDDSIFANSDPATLLHQQKYVLDLFQLCGFLVNFPKSQLHIGYTIDYLGMHIDTLLGHFFVPPAKRAGVLDLLGAILQAALGGLVHVRTLASVKGKLSSMAIAFGPMIRFFTRALDHAIATSVSWDSLVVVTADVLSEVRFWIASFDKFNGYAPIWRSPVVHQVVHTDAAGRKNMLMAGGWGAHISDDSAIHLAHGTWSQEEVDNDLSSSTYLELLAVHRALEAFSPLQPGSNIQVSTDNQNVFRAIEFGSCKAPMCVRAMQDIFLYCVHQRLNLSASWVPRELNTVADALSKFVDHGDIRFSPTEFLLVSTAFGPFHTDVFASDRSAQVPRFFSRFHCPGSAGVNAFAHPWPAISWAFPPACLLAQALAYGKATQAHVAFVLPYWPSAPWWLSLVADDGLHFVPGILAMRFLQPGTCAFQHWSNGAWHSSPPKAYHVLILLCNFGPTRTRDGRIPLPAFSK
jgi:ribonuclease HI